MNPSQSRIRRFAYFYFNWEEPERIRQVVPAHVAYWKRAGLAGYMGGPFSDRSGGLISFLSGSLEEANAIVSQDPFVTEDLIEQSWIKEWIVE